MLTLTDGAKEKIEELCVENQAFAVTLNLVGGGCAGYQYEWGLAETEKDIDEDEELFDAGEGLLAVNVMSLAYMAGSTIDYKKDIMGSMFDIQNPNVKSGCGCGVSVRFDG